MLFVPIFNGLNFYDLSEHVQFHLGVLDLDLAFQIEKLAATINTSRNKDKAHYKAWKR